LETQKYMTIKMIFFMDELSQLSNKHSFVGYYL
jgi:hypothetical protein